MEVVGDGIPLLFVVPPPRSQGVVVVCHIVAAYPYDPEERLELLGATGVGDVGNDVGVVLKGNVELETRPCVDDELPASHASRLQEEGEEGEAELGFGEQQSR